MLKNKQENEIFDSTLTKLTKVGILMAHPHEDQAPLIDWTAEHIRE